MKYKSFTATPLNQIKLDLCMLLANTYNTPFDLVYDELAQSPSSQMVKPEGQAEQAAPGLYIAVPRKRVLLVSKKNVYIGKMHMCT